MTKFEWQLRTTVKSITRNIVLRLKSLTTKVDSDFLKGAVYEQLPIPTDFQKVATQNRELHVEIGSGHGEVLLNNDPKVSIAVGYEIKSRFFKLTRRKIRKRNDIFVFQGNGYESSLLHYKKESIAKLLILFPDPWHKKRHNKRRPITAEYFLTIAQNLKKGGVILVATDWLDYVDFIEQQVKKVTAVYDVEMKPYVPSEHGLPITHFHQKWIRKGRVFNCFVLTKR